MAMTPGARRISLRNLIPCVLVGLLAIILAALLLPSPKWASSGSPVRVVVFDAATSQPIQGATVAVVRAAKPTEESALAAYQESFASAWIDIAEGRMGSRTAADGVVTIDSTFRTGGSHRNPVRAHLDYYWVLVRAEHYAAVAVPLRYEPMPMKSLREQGPLPAYVGLARPAPRA